MSRLSRYLVAAALFGLPSACNAYDPRLLRETLGASTAPAGLDAANAQKPRCTDVREGDGCCPPGAGPLDDSDCGRCGDGLIGPGETCDPPETCLKASDCAPASPCVHAVLSGTAEQCNTRCEVTVVGACRDGDGCCPSSCVAGRDSDCSSACGNGIVEPDKGETCETSAKTQRCPTSCDDADPCTRDVTTGSAETCSLACTHVPISAAADNDGCCPKGATSMTDNDCAPSCGNGVVEAGEACDGTAGCGRNCQPMSDGERCQGMLGKDSCSACACTSCAAPMLHCYQSGDTARDARCKPVVECALSARCIGSCRQDDAYGCYGYCFCGVGALCPGTGPCRLSIAMAAETAVASQISARARDPMYSLYDAENYGSCLRAHCSTQCGL